MGRGARLALEVAAPFPLDVQLLAPPSDAEGGEGGEGGHGGEEGGEGGGEGGGEEGGGNEGGGEMQSRVTLASRCARRRRSSSLAGWLGRYGSRISSRSPVQASGTSLPQSSSRRKSSTCVPSFLDGAWAAKGSVLYVVCAMAPPGLAHVVVVFFFCARRRPPPRPS